MNMPKSEESTNLPSIEPGLYRHKNGGLYEVINPQVVNKTDDNLKGFMVLYKDDDGNMCVRTEQNFRDRFTKVGNGE